MGVSSNDSEPPQRTYENVPDLQGNRLVRWQFRLNGWIGVIGGLGIPTLIGALFGRPLGGLLWGGFLRIAMIHHTTFLVNSVAHLYGTRPYTEENSGRDSGLLAFVTNGEGCSALLRGPWRCPSPGPFLVWTAGAGMTFAMQFS